ncbi:hypothetical protein D4740_00045 [Actinomyces sp. 2119]|uniref:Uncharacterized protein n=1 Tax=Actinomyces lilanjuaniae TaxID=2321394 RepID=A0ABM6Z2Y7_9ACTO|nr:MULTISPECIES: hypothetical protein [Actinomyces]AYD89635.1 hypothetical protein D5R93_05495 [Actinomyces lilanjuaniae]RJF44637.1 hypothetical protein D4740_00045 [Actinomyces sp. 2119]
MRLTRSSTVSSRRLATAALGSACAALCACTGLAGRSPVLTRTNFHGRRVSLRGGAGAAVGSVVACLAAGEQAAGTVVPAAVATGAGAVAGLVDDLDEGAHDGEHVAKGLRGHLGALARGRVTTGVVKIVVIGAGAAVAGGLLAADRGRGRAGAGRARRCAVLGDAVVTTVTIASWANVMNLLDLRPGRTLKATGLVSALVLVVPIDRAAASRRLAAGALGVVAACLPGDLRERTMLGDTGANALGALVGTAVASHPCRVAREAAALLGVVLVLASEKVSFSSVIDKVPALAALDRLGRRP